MMIAVILVVVVVMMMVPINNNSCNNNDSVRFCKYRLWQSSFRTGLKIKTFKHKLYKPNSKSKTYMFLIHVFVLLSRRSRPDVSLVNSYQDNKRERGISFDKTKRKLSLVFLFCRLIALFSQKEGNIERKATRYGQPKQVS